jgi:hypothetical protein
MRTAHARIVAVKVLERQECEVGVIFGPHVGNERAIIGVIQLYQQVVTSGRIAGHEFGYDHIFVVARRAENAEGIGHGVFVPGAAFVAKIKRGVHVGHFIIGVRIEKDVDAVKVAVIVVVGE